MNNQEVCFKMPNEKLDQPVKKKHLELMLQNAIHITEISIDLKERCIQSEKYVNNLQSAAAKAAKNLRNMQTTSSQFLYLAHKIVTNTLSELNTKSPVNTSIKYECERLLPIIERELADVDDPDSELEMPPMNISEKIKNLENKQKSSESGSYLQRTGSMKSVKSDVDEKYPENWSRESLIDLNNVVNLPPVPEDIFTCFSNKPTRTSSLSSLKGMRKVKLFLQRAASNSDDEDSSDLDDHDVGGDNDDKFTNKLCNIKEETTQD